MFAKGIKKPVTSLLNFLRNPLKVTWARSLFSISFFLYFLLPFFGEISAKELGFPLALEKKKNPPPSTHRVFVGKLERKWQFPSDHLPVGLEVEGIRLISWNILSPLYVERTMEFQGLKGSLIGELHQKIDKEEITVREAKIGDILLSILLEKKAEILALQECSLPFLKYLKQHLPPHWTLIKSSSFPAIEDQIVLLYDRKALTLDANLSEIGAEIYPDFLDSALQNLYFSTPAGFSLRIIHTHIPGNPFKASCYHFAKYVYQVHKEGIPTIAFGDCNFEKEQMTQAYQAAGFTSFFLYAPWRTNVDPFTKESKAIDLFFVKGEVTPRTLTPEEICPGESFEAMIYLLNEPNYSLVVPN